MSTKTTFKRIALVAVAALGFGMLSVVPSNAASAASITIGTVPTARPGQTVAVPVTVFLPAGLTQGTDTITVNIEATAAPLQGGSANAASLFNSGATANANNAGALLSFSSTPTGVTPSSTPTVTGGTGVAGRIVLPRDGTMTTSGTGFAAATSGVYTPTAANIAAGSFTLQALITPDVVGNYSFLVSTSAHTSAVAAAASYRAGDVNVSFSLTAGTNTVTGVTLTPLAGSSILADSPNGIPVRVTLTGGLLSGVEGINLTATGGGRIAPSNGAVPGSFAAAGATTALTAASFAGGSSAIIWLRSAVTTAETINLVATSAAMATSVTASRTFSTTAQAGDATNVITLQAPTAGAATAPTFAANNVTGGTAGTSTYTVSTTSTSQRIGYTTPALSTAALVTASGTDGYVTVTDTLGLLTGVPGLVYDLPYSVAFGLTASGGAMTFAANMANVPASTTAYTVAFPQGSAATVGTTAAQTITFRAAAPTSTGGTIRVTPAATILAAPGAALALTATVRDQFGSTILNAPISVRTTGRNNPADTAANTGATGSYTFTTADASTSTINLVDTVTFSSGSATPSSVSITYRDAAVDKVTVTGGNTTASVNALTNTVNGISVGSSTAGAEAGAITITATVVDSLGNALAGVPVSFTVAGTGVAFTSTSATRYTGSTGTATGSLYAWLNGTYTYTVTAGGKSTTGTATFGSIAAGNARVISATVAGDIVTGTAVDRFGNTVANVPLWAVATGGANIGGSFVATGSTGANGTLSWVVSGSGDVRVTAVDPSLPAGSVAAQTCALAGNRTCATATTAAAAYAASTVGTATTAETNVGATFAPAGVASATVTVAGDNAAQAAADAAAEATDAANAATDAANAAAEAADAATAAAQDAADAVAALSTQVTELVSALRKQITSLTNLVIKIQRKVRA
jgi:trimeric autotransporter adhesin